MERRACAAWADAQSILFVCLGNICRSPFAEHLARRSLPVGRTVRSAGYFPEVKRRCPELAVAEASSWAVDLRDHRSGLLTDDLVRESEAVFVFDEQNYRHMRASYPFSIPKLHFIGALNSGGPLFIEDPYGLDRSAFNRVYAAIAALLSPSSQLPGRHVDPVQPHPASRSRLVELDRASRHLPEQAHASGKAGARIAQPVDVGPVREPAGAGEEDGPRISVISKRQRAARICQRIGLLLALERFITRPGLLVLNYHRLGSSAGNPFDDDVYTTGADEFRAQLAYLRKNYDVIGLEDVLRMADDQGALTRPSVLITFDDGYADNFEIGFPILQELGIPAVFFIPTDLIQSPRLTWWDHIAYAIKNTQKTTLTLDYPVRLSIDLQSRKRIDVIRRIHAAYKSGHAIDASAFFDQLDSRLAVRVDPVSLGAGSSCRGSKSGC